MAGLQEGLFNGFFAESLEFLGNLKANNNRVWFEEYKQDYQEYLLRPFQDLVMDLSGFMLSIDPYFETRPAVGRTISRIYRDTRFARNKSPYKSTMWLTFKRPNKQWQDAPAFFFEVSPDAYRYGMGYYSASKDTMDRFREMIDHKPEEFLEAIAFFSKQKVFEIEGERYKRLLDESKSEEMQNWYQRKNLYLVCNKKIDRRFFGRGLFDDLTHGFGLLASFYRYLRDGFLS